MAKLKRYIPADRMGELVGQNYEILHLLSRFGMSLGFGDSTIDEVCSRHGVHTATFLAIVNTMLDHSYSPTKEDGEISIDCFLKYLHNSHTYYLNFRLPEIRRKLITAIDGCHGDVAFAVIKFYDEYVAEVRRHLEYEESTVFPYVRQLLELTYQGTYSIDAFLSQHDRIEEKLTELKNILLQYFPADYSYDLNGVLFDIFNCESDLASHNYVEDHLFVPLVRQLEESIQRPTGEDVSSQRADSQESLSSREREIVICVVKGMTNKQIAEQLFLSTHTVITHRRNIASKLRIRSAAGLTIYAIVNKLVELNEVKDTIYSGEENE